MTTLTALLGAIAADSALAALLAECRDRDASDPDPTHDAAHALRVALWTLRLGGDAVAWREAVAAALLHDAVNPPKDSPERAHASLRSAAFAREQLPARGFTGDAVERIADAIRDHSFSRGAVPRTPLGCALQDADRLEALGAIGLLRCVATGVRMGGAWFDASDPWAEQRPLDDRRYSLDHFATKLLRLPATMRTAAGRAEAARRAGFLRRFMHQLSAELDRPRPHATLTTMDEPVRWPEQVSERPRDPVIEAYKAGVDRTLLRENLKLSPAERLRRLDRHLRSARILRGRARRP